MGYVEIKICICTSDTIEAPYIGYAHDENMRCVQRSTCAK